VGQEQVKRQETKDTKSTKDSKDAKGAKGAEGKGGAAGAGGAGGIKAKGKAKGKDLGDVGALIGGSDQYAVDDGENERRRKRRSFFDNDQAAFEETPWEEDGAFAVSNINAEFRAQVASGLAAARSFTRGTVGPKGQEEDDDDDDD